jgi:hypothetical protein
MAVHFFAEIDADVQHVQNIPNILVAHSNRVANFVAESSSDLSLTLVLDTVSVVERSFYAVINVVF